MRRHPHLLEISAWPWLERLSRQERRRVTLADVPGEAWDALRDRGFDAVFLMGVWQRSAVGRLLARVDLALLGEYDRALPGWAMRDIPGSPYSVSAYEPDERMGGWRGLSAARRALNERGMALVLDFVTNHTAFDHPWVLAHPERYVLGTLEDYRAAPDGFRPVQDDGRVHFVACGRDPYFPPWRDVAQLNYFNPETREAMRGVLREIARHADGVRCDMAMLVLNEVFEGTWGGLLRGSWRRPGEEFWPEAIASAPMMYLAEVYWGLERQLQQAGFDFTYDKGLLDALLGSGPGEARRHVRATSEEAGRLARFLENHDEARSAVRLEHRLPAAATLLCTLPGMRFFFDGQLEGARVRAPVQLGRWQEEPSDPRIQNLYERLLDLASSPVFHEGEWRLLEVAEAGSLTFENLIAYRWRSGERLVIVAVNPGAAAAQGHVRFEADSDLPPGGAFDLQDRLDGRSYRWARQALAHRGLYVRLEPGQAHAFEVRPAAFMPPPEESGDAQARRGASLSR